MKDRIITKLYLLLSNIDMFLGVEEYVDEDEITGSHSGRFTQEDWHESFGCYYTIFLPFGFWLQSHDLEGWWLMRKRVKEL